MWANLLDHKVMLAQLGHRVMLVPPVLKAMLAPLVPLVLRVMLGLLGHKVILALQAQLDLRVTWVLRVPLVHKVM